MRQVLNNIIAFVGVLDTDGVLVEVNESPLAVAGVSEKDVVGKHFWDCVWWNYSAESRQRLKNAVARALEGETARYDTLIQTAGDGRMWIDFQLAPLRDESGRIDRLIASGTDLSARRSAESRLRATERRFRSTFENAAVGMAHVGLDGQFLDVNRRLCEFLGYEKSELLERTFRDVTHPDDINIGIESFKNLLLGEIDVYESQKRYVAKNGDTVWAQLTTSLQRDENDAPEHLISIIQDISDRKRAEDELARNQERLRSAQLAGGVGLFEWDIAKGRLHWTPELETLYGIEPGSFGGAYEDWAERVHPEDLTGAEEAVRQSLETGEFQSEWRTTTPAGEERWIAARGWVQHDEQGRPHRMIGMNVDVSERRRHEEQMRTVMAELNHRVKNTLAVIQSIAHQTIRRADSLESFAGRFLPRIHSMARAHSLLTQSEWAGADLRDILESEIEPRAATRDRYLLEGPPVSLRPKAALTMHMIVHELATNAIKHGALRTHHGRIRVSWSVENNADATLAVQWQEQAPAGRAPKTLESGFGSQLIQRLVEYELAGVIHSEITSHGVTHHFRFPLAAGAAEAPLPVRLSLENAAGAPRILVVEDAYALAMTLRDELEDAGYTVLGPCATLARGRQVARDERVDFAVLDVDLGGELVYPLARDLRERAVPFLLLTGFNRQDLVREFRDAHLVNKPIEHGRVADLVARALAPAAAAGS